MQFILLQFFLNSTDVPVIKLQTWKTILTTISFTVGKTDTYCLCCNMWGNVYRELVSTLLPQLILKYGEV